MLHEKAKDAGATGSKKDEETDTAGENPQPKITLHFFDVNDEGECIRLSLLYSGLIWNDFRFTCQAQLQALIKDGKAMFDDVPLLEVDGKFVAQPRAILRYVGQLSNIYGKRELYPRDPYKAAIVDAVMDFEAEAFRALMVSKYMKESGFAVPCIPEEAIPLITQAQNDTVLPQKLQMLERVLKQSTTQWFASTTGPTIADFYWACFFSRIESENWTGCRELLSKFPLLQELRSDVYELEFPEDGRTSLPVDPLEGL